MSETEEVLKANDLFYRAFRERDMGLMDDVWAKGAPVSCIHPGWALINEREMIIDSWKAILEAADFPEVDVEDEEVTIYGDVALVVCFELIGEGELIATNTFVKEDGAWRMVHHQAGPLAGYDQDQDDAGNDFGGEDDSDDDDDRPRTLH